MSDQGYPTTEWIYFIIVFSTFSILIFLNVIILRIIRRTRLTTPTYKLIANQTVSEILYCILAISRCLICWSRLVNDWPHFSILCGLTYTLSDCSLYESVFSMLIIAYERYRKLYRPLSLNLNLKLWIAITWITALVLASFNNVSRRNVLFFDQKSILGCKVIFETDLDFFGKRFNFLIVFTLCFVLPLLATSFFYYKVIRRILERKQIGTNVSDERHESFCKKKRNTIKMLVVILLFYFLFAMPIYIYAIVRAFLQNFNAAMICDPNKITSFEFHVIAGFFYLGSICINPFVIFYYNPDFRRELFRILYFDKFSFTDF